MNDTLRNRAGMALPMVLGAIILVGTLVAGVMFLATQDFRVGANDLNETRAGTAAEMGLSRLLTDWDQSKNTSMATADTFTKSYTDVAGASVNVFVTRLPGPFFWAVSEAKTRGNSLQYGSRRRYGTLLRLNTPTVNFLGAVTASGNVKVSGNVTINGNDVSPSGWPCTGTLTNMPGAVITPTATTSISGSVTVTGNPPSTTSAAAGDTNTYFNYGGSTYTSLASTANITLAGGTYNGMGPVVSGGVLGVGGVCDKSQLMNWGDPVRHTPAAACESYFPIIHITGDATLTGGSGQGILLVDGSLTMSGNFAFTGVVITRGTAKASGTGNSVTGVIMAAAVDLSQAATLTGNTMVQYSSCAVQQSLASSSTLLIAKGRPWVNLY
jgi:hypothetical protein